VRIRLIVLLALCATLGPLTASARGASHFKPCAGAGAPAPFVHYYLGGSFEGDSLTDATYECFRPSGPPDEPIARTNLTDYGYGHCEAPCALPISVQTWPACDRWWGLYNFAPPDLPIRRPRLTKIRGVPASRADGGHSLELYTGDVTVVIFANSRKRANRAAAVLRRAPDSPGGVEAGEELPSPLHGALRGRIDCGFRFSKLAIRPREGTRGWRAVVRLKVGRPASIDVELERREKGQWVSSEQAIYRVGRGTSGHRIPIRPGLYRATVTATDRLGRRTRVRTLHFRASDKE